MTEKMISTRFRLLIALMLMSGCAFGQTNTPKVVPSNKAEASFLADPGCYKAYRLVGDKKEAAVPLILEALDRFAGETNAETRCEIIQGALYKSENCTNTAFLAIIQKGTNDPSASVRAKTTKMVDGAMKKLGKARK